jgi:hypothetical protein
VPLQSSTGVITYELRTQDDARVIWGAAPGSESESEPSAEQKMALLENLVADKGPLDHAASRVIDLRQHRAPGQSAGSGQPFRR